MVGGIFLFCALGVVPLAGDVDRNRLEDDGLIPGNQSSPSRGTWIEIPPTGASIAGEAVVPLAGDVDRNGPSSQFATRAAPSSPSRGTWIEIRSSPAG